MGVNEGRLLPFAFQESEAMEALREGIPPSGGAVKRQVAVAVYQAITEVANERRLRAEFEAARKEVAAKAGVATKTVDRCVIEFERLGLLEVDRGTEALPALWTLTRPSEAKRQESTPEPGPKPTKAISSKSAKQREFIETLDDLLDSDLDLSKPEAIEPKGDGEIVLDGLDLLRQGKQVAKHVVTPREMGIAAVAIATFNRCFEWKDKKGSDYGLGANLTSVVMRIRDRPSWDAAKHARLVESAWRIRWWEQSGDKSRRPSPNVVYGDKSFENVVQDARDEAAGVSVGQIKKRRYTRS